MSTRSFLVLVKRCLLQLEASRARFAQGIAFTCVIFLSLPNYTMRDSLCACALNRIDNAFLDVRKNIAYDLLLAYFVC